MTVITPPMPQRVDNVAKGRDNKGGKSGPGRPPVGKQTAVRLPADLQANLEEIASGMGLDLSSVMRMILTEQHRPYLERVRQRTQQEAEPSEG